MATVTGCNYDPVICRAQSIIQRIELCADTQQSWTVQTHIIITPTTIHSLLDMLSTSNNPSTKVRRHCGVHVNEMLPVKFRLQMTQKLCAERGGVGVEHRSVM